MASDRERACETCGETFFQHGDEVACPDCAPPQEQATPDVVDFIESRSMTNAL